MMFIGSMCMMKMENLSEKWREKNLGNRMKGRWKVFIIKRYLSLIIGITFMFIIYGCSNSDVVADEPMEYDHGDSLTLTDIEREERYDYFQNVLLDGKKRKEIEDIASFMSEKDIGKLTERLNEKVVVSADALEDEIAMIQAYVFTGDKRPSELDVERDTKEKLEIYLIVLKNYHSTMGDETIAQVNKLEYEKDPKGIKGHYLDTGLEIAEYDSHINKHLSEEEFRQISFNSTGHMSNTINRTEVTNYTTADAAILKSYLETQKRIDNRENNIVNQTFGRIISQLGEPVTTVKKVFDDQMGKNELAEDIKIGEAKNTAAFLNMEFTISENRSYPGSSAELDVQLYPTETTFVFFDRWEEAYNNDQDLLYPADLIESEDWQGINDYWFKHHTEIASSDEYDYIRHGTE